MGVVKFSDNESYFSESCMNELELWRRFVHIVYASYSTCHTHAKDSVIDISNGMSTYIFNNIWYGDVLDGNAEIGYCPTEHRLSHPRWDVFELTTCGAFEFLNTLCDEYPEFNCLKVLYV